ncbi:SdiA-regulated domain-containing protein [Niabella aurantiaca]|uniref:SdiA-regulated domain-containing protein n=1 Tax=Niabella aurantiaca TaxID=379900 RepID=UPI00037732F6|nr:SdiA-regulated domain-containing protein [Niabella aurantiaca]
MNKLGMLLFCLATIACRGQKEYTSPAGYDLSHPETLKMPAVLDEISGISFADGSDTVYAIQDESGTVFHFKPGDKDLVATKFGKKGDYEDLSVWNDRLIVLRSDGSLYGFPVQETSLAKAVNVKEWKKPLPEGEYEALYANPATNEIVVLCKQCAADKKTGKVSGYILEQVKDSLTIKNRFAIDASAPGKGSSKHKGAFKPSALTRNPQTGQWYILSSVNKLLVLADQNWQVTETHRLRPSLFSQPEGIAFDKEGNLFISNERGPDGNGAILKFERK